jgi:deazaflavin-dependent oxidoreductase (nitroreductase family)
MNGKDIPMNKTFLHLFMRFNIFLIHISRGKIGSQLGKQTILLMHTTGRKTAKNYITPIAYFPTGASYYVIASNWGQPHNAAWYYNLQTQPEIIIEVKGKTIPVRAREAQAEEYDSLWANAVSHHPDYLKYKIQTSRHIPIIVFDPRS